MGFTTIFVMEIKFSRKEKTQRDMFLGFNLAGERESRFNNCDSRGWNWDQ